MQAKSYENGPVPGSGEILLTIKEAQRCEYRHDKFLFPHLERRNLDHQHWEESEIEPAAIAELIERLRAGNSYITYEANKADYSQPLHTLPKTTPTSKRRSSKE